VDEDGSGGSCGPRRVCNGSLGRSARESSFKLFRRPANSGFVNFVKATPSEPGPDRIASPQWQIHEAFPQQENAASGQS